MRKISVLNVRYLCSEETAFENLKNMLEGGKKGAHLTFSEILKEFDLLIVG